MNDAGTVIVADVYAAGEAPIAGVTRDALVDGSARARPSQRGAAAVARATGGDGVRHRQAGRFRRLPRGRQHHAWAAALPARTGRAAGSAASREVRHDGRCAHPELRRNAADVARPRAGECAARAVHLVPRRRSGRSAGAAGRRGGSCAVPARPAARHSGARDRRVLEPDHARRRAAGRGDPAGAWFWRRSRSKRTASSPAPPRSMSPWPNMPPPPGSPGWNFCPAFPARIGGAVVMNARRLWRRHRVLPRLGRDRHAQRRATPPVRGRSRVRLSPLRVCRMAPWSCAPGCVRGPASPAAIAARMAEIRAAREASQPVRARTGGSTFRNPPDMKAWELIDAAGCRGLTRGGAQVSEKHCNFLINTGDGHRRRPRRSRRGSASPRARRDRGHAGMGNPPHRRSRRLARPCDEPDEALPSPAVETAGRHDPCRSPVWRHLRRTRGQPLDRRAGDRRPARGRLRGDRRSRWAKTSPPSSPR